MGMYIRLSVPFVHRSTSKHASRYLFEWEAVSSASWRYRDINRIETHFPVELRNDLFKMHVCPRDIFQETNLNPRIVPLSQLSANELYEIMQCRYFQEDL